MNMKRFMMKYLMLNCKEATLLMAKKEEGKLSFIGKLQLSMHTSMCSFCRKFEKQTKQISKESKHVHAEESMSAAANDRIIKMIDEHSF
jgi:anti-sigma factor ChrR (cupin superfamily)